jgi:hypothetical protein
MVLCATRHDPAKVRIVGDWDVPVHNVVMAVNAARRRQFAAMQPSSDFENDTQDHKKKNTEADLLSDG